MVFGGRLYHFYDGLWYNPTGCEPTTYCMRCGHANLVAIPIVLKKGYDFINTFKTVLKT